MYGTCVELTPEKIKAANVNRKEQRMLKKKNAMLEGNKLCICDEGYGGKYCNQCIYIDV